VLVGHFDQDRFDARDFHRFPPGFSLAGTPRAARPYRLMGRRKARFLSQFHGRKYSKFSPL
jgi:hypothetical protein